MPVRRFKNGNRNLNRNFAFVNGIGNAANGNGNFNGDGNRGNRGNRGNLDGNNNNQNNRRQSAAVPKAAEVTVRRVFPESWLWSDFTTSM